MGDSIVIKSHLMLWMGGLCFGAVIPLGIYLILWMDNGSTNPFVMLGCLFLLAMLGAAALAFGVFKAFSL